MLSLVLESGTVVEEHANYENDGVPSPPVQTGQLHGGVHPPSVQTGQLQGGVHPPPVQTGQLQGGVHSPPEHRPRSFSSNR